MIGFNALLRNEGIDPADVKLVRHQDLRHAERTTPYQPEAERPSSSSLAR